MAVGAAIAALLAPAAARAAGTYTVWTCRGPDGSPVSAQAWQSAGSPVVTDSDTCAAGGTSGALSATIPAGSPSLATGVDGGYRFQSPAGSEIVGYRLWRVEQVSGLALTAGWFAGVREDDIGGAGTDVDDCYRGTLLVPTCTSNGTTADPFDASNLVQRSGLHIHSVALLAGCQALVALVNCVDSGAGSGQADAAFTLYRAAFDIADTTPPALGGAATGDLLTGTAGGTQMVTVPLADGGGGVRSAQATIDGTPVASASAPGCTQPYTQPVPCPPSTTLALQIDTTGLTDGSHQLDVTATDAAGNAASVLSKTVQVSNASPPPPAPTVVVVPSPPGKPQTIVVPPPKPAVPGDYVIRLTPRRVPAGSRATLSGRVLRRDGTPEAHAQLVLQRRRYGPYGGGWRDGAKLTADAHGRFQLPIPGSAQALRLRLLPPRAATTTFLSPVVSVVSRMHLTATVTPTALRNHQTIAIRGQIAGADGAALRKEVLVQSVVGGHWLVVDRVYADARGRFGWRYRFQRTTHDAIYRFRISVVADDDRWPWRTATTAPMAVHVRP